MTIDESCAKYHWLKIGDDGVPEMYLDHHALSTFRMCEGHFQETHLKFYSGKGRLPWGLAFGIVFHKVIEYIYESKATENFQPQVLYQVANDMWTKADLDWYATHPRFSKNYNLLGGREGFIALVIQYTAFYSGEGERLRPIATEIAFGKAKEVPLGSFTYLKYVCGSGVNNSSYKNINVRCYLTGRIDFLMDSGNAIGPMDHKTRAFFSGDPLGDYQPQDGMTGYIYATQSIVKKNFPELAAKRDLNKMWMNFILVKNEPDHNKRFKRLPLMKTDWELEQFRLRQLRTFEKIFDLVVNNKTPDWNTNACTDWYHGQCSYKNVHRQGSESAMVQILNADFEVKEAWNPETVED